MICRSKF